MIRENRPFGFDERLPDDIRLVYQALANEVVNLNIISKVYFGLFETREDTNQLLHIANATFVVIHRALLTELILTITRLCDPVSSVGKKNITLNILKSYFGESDPIFSKVAEFERLCKSFKTFRCQVLAHKDKQTVLNRDEVKIPDFKMKVDKIIELTADIMNTFFNRFVPNESLGFEFPIIHGGPDGLLRALRKYQISMDYVMKMISP
ncbi:MAG: hypothetical protein TUN42_03570 [Dehalogenimonas sp.]